MSDAGGQITHLGVGYQDKIAALFLGRMIDPGPWQKNQEIKKVCIEDPTAEVNDVVLYYQDHTEWILVKLDIQIAGVAWVNFWEHMINQWWNRPLPLSEDDMLVLAISQTHDWVEYLEGICRRARGSRDVVEWEDRLTKGHKALIGRIIKDVLGNKRPKYKPEHVSTTNESTTRHTGSPVPDKYLQPEALFELFTHMEVWTQFDPDKIKSDHGHSFMPQSNLEWYQLFDILLAIAGNIARKGKSISREDLIEELNNKNIFLAFQQYQKPWAVRTSVSVPEVLNSPKVKESLGILEDFYKDALQSRIQKRAPFQTWIYTDPEVKEALVTMFHGKCAFCETPTGRIIGDIGHFRPKGGSVGLDRKQLDPDHYWWLVYEWHNLYWICQICNDNKANKFPVIGERAPLLTPWEELHYQEKALLLDPCEEHHLVRHLTFLRNGEVVGTTDQGQVTIEVFALNRQRLVMERKLEIESVIRQLAYLSDIYDKEIEDIPRLIPLLKQKLSPASAYSVAKRQNAVRWYLDVKTSLGSGVVKLYDELFRSIDIPIATILGKASPVLSLEKKPKPEVTESVEIRPKVSEQVSGRLGSIKAHYLARLEIHNFRVIKDLTLEFSVAQSSINPWMVLLGENGVGKSSVLKAVALALMGEERILRLGLDASRFVRYRAHKGFVKVYLTGYDSPFELRFRRGDPMFYCSAPDLFDPLLLLGYSSTRLLPSGDHTPSVSYGIVRIANLFDPFLPLIDARTWLLSLRKESFGYSARAIKDLLLREEEDTLVKSGTIPREVKLKIPSFGTSISLEELSDGYQSIIAVASDILSVALKEWKRAEDSEGIVLLDEIDVHLHPRWKMEVIESLRRAFPRLQFLVTTHDPLCLLGTQPGEINVLTRDQDTKQIRATQIDLPPGITADRVLTGFWFGLPSTFDDDTRQLLADHRKLLRQGVPEDDLHRRDLESILRRRLGTYGDTSIDRMAQSVAAEIIQDDIRTMGPAERQIIREKLLERLREKRQKN